MEKQIEKVIRDGKVAVVISSRFGAGWYTWNTGYEELLFHPKIVYMIENGNRKKITSEWLRENIGIGCGEDDSNGSEDYIFADGNDSLIIQWLPVGTKFSIHEYDGSESILTENSLALIA